MEQVEQVGGQHPAHEPLEQGGPRVEAGRGFRVTGIDLSPKALELAAATITADNSTSGDVDIDNESSATFQEGDGMPDKASVSASLPIRSSALIDLTKSVVSITNPDTTDGGSSVDEAGDVINYEITIENDGNVALSETEVRDIVELTYADVDLTGTSLDDDGTLNVGETWTYTISYTVTQADIDDLRRQLDEAFAQEHALEVQLPFLQTVLPAFKLIPLVVGQADSEDVARVIETLVAADTLIVVSSDLSHFLDYDSCQRRDRSTSTLIEQMQADKIGPHDACGAFPLRGLLKSARHHGWHARTLDLRNSGDTAGDKSRVVGYGAYEFY